MNTLHKKSNKLIQLTLISSLVFSVSTAFANHPIKVESKNTDSAKVTNVSTSMSGNLLSVSGKLSRVPGSSVIIPGIVKIELLDADGKVLKTVKTKHRRHTHYVNTPYKFSARVPVESHNVSMVRVQHEMK